MGQRAETSLKLQGVEAWQRFFGRCFASIDSSVENLWVAHVDEQSNCLHLSHHSGDQCAADLPVRSIIADAIRLSSAGLALAHNHPSGDPRPSDSDCRATRRLAAAAEAIDCHLLDHFVFAAGQVRSFRRLGLL